MSVRVLHIGPLPPPLGGVSTMMKALMGAEGLKQFEHSCFDTSWGTSWEIVGRKKLDATRVLRRIKLAMNLVPYVRKLKPSIVHFQCGSGGPWDFPGDMLMFAGARSGGARSILHWHRDPREASYPGRSFLARSFFRATAAKADAMLVLSETYRQALTSSPFSDKVLVVPNAIDSNLLSIDRGTRSEGRIRVVFMGRLTREKGILDVLRVASCVLAEVPDVEFALAGTPSPEEGGTERLRSIIAAEGLKENVCLVGPVLGDQKRQFFELGDIVLFPSYRESFGIVALEGMAAGLPVITYSVGLLPELVGDGVAGYLVQPGDVSGLTLRLLELIRDSAVRERMGRAGREIAKRKYEISVVADQVRQIYMRLVETSRSASA